MEPGVVGGSRQPTLHASDINALDVVQDAERIVCWICRDRALASETINANEEWVVPCLCEGERKYVHQSCLLEYITTNLYNNVGWDVRCSWCGALYLLESTSPSLLFDIQNLFDRALNVATVELFSRLLMLCTTHCCHSYSLFLLDIFGAEAEFFQLTHKIGSFFQNVILTLAPAALVIFETYNWECIFASKLIKMRINFERNQSVFSGILWGLPTRVPDTPPTPVDIAFLDGQQQDIFQLRIFNNIAQTTDTQPPQSQLNFHYPSRKGNMIGSLLTGLAMPIVSHIFSLGVLPNVTNNLLRVSLGWLCIQGIRGGFRLAHRLNVLNYIFSIKIRDRRHF